MRDLSKKLIKLYLLALLLVALFSILSQVLVQYSIKEQQSDSRVINIAGRQRMLSQRLTKIAILIAYPQIYMPNSEIYLSEIHDILELWHTCHQGLMNGNLPTENGMTIKVKNSPTIDSMFVKLHPHFETMYNNALCIDREIQNPTPFKADIMEKALNNILSSEPTFLRLMDAIVFQYDAEAKKRTEDLKKIELLLFSVTLLILFLEGIFIFRPTYFQINYTLNQLLASEDELKQLNEQLSITNQNLITTQKELLKTTEEKYQLQMKEQEVRAASLLEGQEDERKRLALDLHDGIGQMLTALKLNAEKLNENEFATEKSKKTLELLKQLINNTISETRTIAFNLMPSVLSDFGIEAALKLLIEQTQKNAPLNVSFDCTLNHKRLEATVEIALYRICQEALANTLKHAHASQVDISLFTHSNFIVFTYQDNGVGFDMRKKNTKNIKNGLRNMEARVRILKGEFKINAQKNKGTGILIKIPINTVA